MDFFGKHDKGIGMVLFATRDDNQVGMDLQNDKRIQFETGVAFLNSTLSVSFYLSSVSLKIN
jgi:hypothetical protein